MSLDRALKWNFSGTTKENEEDAVQETPCDMTSRLTSPRWATPATSWKELPRQRIQKVCGRWPIPRAAAGQMGAPSRILLLCPLPQILWKFKKTTYHRGQNRTLIKYKSKYINKL